MTSPTRLWLVDDDDELRGSIEQALSIASATTRLTGSFGSAASALSAIDRGEEPDVALIDLGLPEMSGHALIGELRRRRPHLPMLAFTVMADDDAVFSALRAGARGYITKETTVPELILAVEDAISGGAPLSRSVSLRVISHFWQRDGSTPHAVESLTVRERKVLEILCTGASYRETGLWLGVSEGTIQTHVKSIYEKLGVCSKAEAVRMACEAGLVTR